MNANLPRVSERERQAFAAYGAEIVGVNPGESVVLKFASTTKMMSLIGDMKKADSNIKFNSKKDDDGNHVVTVFYSRSRPAAYV